MGSIKNLVDYEVSVADLSKWRSEQRVIYTMCNHNNKALKLLITPFGGFEITLDGKIIHECEQLFDIVGRYNLELKKL